MVKRFIMVMLALLTIGVQAFAQNVVTGKVADAKGEPVVGAGVQVKGTTVGVVTDLDGQFSIKTDAKATLVISSIGYKTAEVAVGNRTSLNVVLEEDALFLDDVVVVGYGTARKRDVSGAIASLNYGNDQNIANLPNPNALAALSSRIAGFSYAPTSSAGGDNTNSMTIRGMNVIPSSGQKTASAQSLNKPLIILDGVIFGGSINEVNTSDIQSIDVLKDASAAAIYGSRAANGVIVITTKSASSETPVVNFNASVSLSDWTRAPKYVTDETTFFRNRYYAKAASDASLLTKDYATYDKNSLFVSNVESAAYGEGIYTNWIDEISRTGVGQKYDLSVSGRGKSASYYVSGDYTRQQGIRLGDDYEKFNILTKVDVDVKPWLKVGVKGSYLGANSWGTPARIQNATWMSPYSYVMCQIDGYTDWYNSKPDGNTISPLWGTGSGDSYLWTKNVSKSNNLNGLAYAQIDFPFIPGLSYRFSAQGRRSLSRADQFSTAEIWISTDNTAQMDDPNGLFGTNAGGYSTSSDNFYWNVDNILTYAKDFGENHMDFMLGYTREKSLNNSLRTDYTGFGNNPEFLWYDQDAADNMTIGRGASQTTAIGYLARANYNFANKYYLTANFRRDGYSVFYPGHKWGNYFGVSAAWVLSNEDFIKDLGLFDFLKVRLSYGENGSRTIGAYTTTSMVVTSGGNSGARTHAWLGGKSAYGIKFDKLPNYSLTWAKVTKGNLGIDFSVKNNRISGSIDAYIGKTTNMLVDRSAAYFTGFSSAKANAGLVTNNGVEIVLNTVNMDGNGKDALRWESNIVFDTNANKLKSLYDGVHKDVQNYLVTPESYYALVEGYPITAVYDLTMLGIFQDQDEIDAYTWTDPETGAVSKIMSDALPGDVKFADTNNDGKINDDDRTVIGTTDPLFTLNFGNTFTWKGFSLYFNFRWMQGDKTHFLGLNPNYYTAGQGSGSQLKGVEKWVDSDYYKNHSNVFPRHGYNQDTYKYQWWCDRSFLKLKDLSFSYTLPKKIVAQAGLSNVRVYVAGTDLFTITKWTGLDPETGGTIAANASSSRYGSNGTYKTVTFGVNLTF
ncbi:MAG: SusC/RagA family TonB-linked outer membrane protein [Bacteroidales bacterium]|nr:SusC/RagA family TonB-linked outer membrane protein [Bacteroidales bacterium]